MRLLIATPEPQRFDPWLPALRQEGIEVCLAAPDRRSLGRTLAERAPAVALLDLQAESATLGEFRALLDRLYPGETIGLISVVRHDRLALLAGEECDDVLEPAAAPAEVLFRVRRVAGRLLRRPAAIQLGPLTLHPAEGEAWLAGRPLFLRQREFQLLRFLAARPNRVFGRAELAREAWGPGFRGSPRAVDTQMSRLRRKLGEFGQRHLQTVRCVGYRLALPTPEC